MSLSDVIIYGSEGQLREALKQSPELNEVDEYGYTPLIEAAIADNLEKAKLLIEAGADVNQKDLTKRTALHWAVDNSNLALATLLLENDADPNAFNIASQPVLVKPLLRRQKAFKKLLLDHGANLTFANDFINTKLLGHRFELIGSADIANPNSLFTEVDYEGFYFEFTLDLIRNSILNFKLNFAARHMRAFFKYIDDIAGALMNASDLMKYDRYLIDAKLHKEKIEAYLQKDPLVIPISQEGHAIALVKHGNLLAICDRAEHDGQRDCISIYYMNKPYKLTTDLLMELIYEKQELELIHKSLPATLGLQEIAQIPMRAQLIGNCSWANVEAVIPALYLMLAFGDESRQANLVEEVPKAISLFYEWCEWDKERALQFFIQNFESANPARKASIAAVLGGIVFQRCSAESEDDVQRAKRIIPLLRIKGYRYIIDSYLEFYVKRKRTMAGENFEKLLHLYEIEEGF